MIQTEKIHLWTMTISWDEAVIFIKHLIEVANSQGKSGFKKSVSITPELIEICQGIVMEAEQDFEFIEQKPVEQKIKAYE